MSATTIVSVKGRRVWDSRGRPTVEAEVAVAKGAIGRAIAPAGASKGSGEAVELRDGGPAFGGLGVDHAVAQVNGPIAAALERRDAADQAAIDATLIALDGTSDKSKLGGNAMIAVSMAVLHAAAGANRRPLWRNLAEATNTKPRLPMPMIQIFGGGAHAAGRLDLQDFLVIPLGADSFDRALAMCAEVYAAAGRLMDESGKRAGVADEGGWWPDFAGNEEAIADWCAPSRPPASDPARRWASRSTSPRPGCARARYRLGREVSRCRTDAMIATLADWVGAIPSSRSRIRWPRTIGTDMALHRHGRRIQVIGDDLLVTDDARPPRRGHARLQRRPDQAEPSRHDHGNPRSLQGGQRRWARHGVSARSGESEDTTIVHLAVGWDAGQLKVGSFARSERMAKWNEGLRIAEALGAAEFAGRTGLARR